MSNYVEGIVAIVIFFGSWIFLPLAIAASFPMNAVFFGLGVLVASLGLMIPLYFLREWENRRRKPKTME
ncbi:hypothetical protein [Desertivibrio insolitus]|uniref:hypothetical protein n=1 Tax=Herbiconiux sp. SYSU D00978 TaxID=2812562 RepID=UPI001A97618E|nr:hypothetical protein [Herbiconiux sp. SYSU D00978]